MTIMSRARTAFLYMGALLLQSGPAQAAERAEARPNIVIILADDLGFSDVGCYGSSIATPTLDGLAARGLRFTQFYNCARCCPSRAALLTGLYPHQAGVGHMLQDWNAPGYTNGLNEHCVTIAELLREAGYHTYLVGKWHVGGLGKSDSFNFPRHRGFEHYYGGDGGGNYFAPNPLYRDDTRIKPEARAIHDQRVQREAAVQFINEHQRAADGKPFFLHLCYNAPHFPLQALPEDIARYEGKYKHGWDVERQRRYDRQKELGIIDPRWLLSPRPRGQGLDRNWGSR